MSTPIGYCTNVHAGKDLRQTRANLAEHAPAVKRRCAPNEPMGVGLWLAASAARELLADEGAIEEFRGWLHDENLVPYTLNGFPYGDFHRDVVKHDVYRPTWLDHERLDYTRGLIAALDRLLPEGHEGSISTMPLMWGHPAPDSSQLAGCAANLRTIADELARLEAERGRLIHLCIEPEPGCALDTADDVVRFFKDHLLRGGGNDETIRRHIRVCHDVCHAAVMFEDQADVLRRYREAGIGVGKVQVSSAVHADFAALAEKDRPAAFDQLQRFDEPRYLHQTCVRDSPENTPRFYEDLPAALEQAGPGDSGSTDAAPSGEWRVHFHVPIYLESFGLLGTSRQHILGCLQAAAREADIPHWEVETYAWSVLPEELRQPELADGIAEELRWLEQARNEPVTG